jgi:transposase
MPRLSEDQRRAAVKMLMNGSLQHNVAHRFGVHKSTLSRLCDRLRTTGTTNERPRPGRSRVTTRRENAFIRATHLRDRFQTRDQTARTLRGLNNNRLCARTVSNRLREADIRVRQAYTGLPLTRARHQWRMNWLHHRPGVFSIARWRRVFFSDVSVSVVSF